MKPLRIALSSAFLALALLPGTVAGQDGAFAFQIRGGIGLPQGSFGSKTAGAEGESGHGPSFGMGFTFPGPGPAGLFLGFGQRRFSCDPEVCPRGAEWASTGFDVALRHVLDTGSVRSWVQGGIHTHRIEGEGWDEEGDPVPKTSEGAVGFEVGAGILIRVGRRVSLTPGIRYGWGETPFRDGLDLRLRYLVMDMGLLLGF